MGNGASTSRARSLVLVVDDDANLRPLLGRVLRFGGYDVVEAGSAEEAIVHIAAMRDRVAAVLTDLEMPGMGGEGLVAYIHRERQRLPVLVLTGGRRRIATLSPERQLVKPMRPEALLDALGDAIRAARIPDEDVHVVTIDVDDLIDVDDGDDDPEMPSQ